MRRFTRQQPSRWCPRCWTSRYLLRANCTGLVQMSVPFSPLQTEVKEGNGVRTGLGANRGGVRGNGGDRGVRASDLPLGDTSLGGRLLGGGEGLGGSLSLLVALDLFRVAVLECGSQRRVLSIGAPGHVGLTKNMSTMTGHASGAREIEPRRRRTSRQRSHQMRPIECFDLLLAGMATST